MRCWSPELHYRFIDVLQHPLLRLRKSEILCRSTVSPMMKCRVICNCVFFFSLVSCIFLFCQGVCFRVLFFLYKLNWDFLFYSWNSDMLVLRLIECIELKGGNSKADSKKTYISLQGNQSLVISRRTWQQGGKVSMHLAT